MTRAARYHFGRDTGDLAAVDQHVVGHLMVAACHCGPHGDAGAG
jgi:hypothetical protein